MEFVDYFLKVLVLAIAVWGGVILWKGIPRWIPDQTQLKLKQMELEAQKEV